MQLRPRLFTPRQLRLQLEHDVVKAQTIGFAARAHGDGYGRTGLGSDWSMPAVLVLILRHLPAMSAYPSMFWSQVDRPGADSCILGIEDAVHLGSDFVVDDCPAVVRDDIYPEFLHCQLRQPEGFSSLTRLTHDRVLALELERLALQPLRRQPLIIDKSPIGRFDIFDVDLSLARFLLLRPRSSLFLLAPTPPHADAIELYYRKRRFARSGQS